MKFFHRFRRSIACLMLFSLVNPLWVQIAWGRDTDIYRNINFPTSARPNVVIMLDTSDSMNLPVDWAEVPGAYDSHTEYLDNNGTLNSPSIVPTDFFIGERTDGRVSSDGVTINSLTSAGGIATVTTYGAHGFQVGATVTISGATESAYNGIFAIQSVPASNRFTFQLTATPVVNTAYAASLEILIEGENTWRTVSKVTTRPTYSTPHFQLDVSGGPSKPAGTRITLRNAWPLTYNGTFTTFWDSTSSYYFEFSQILDTTWSIQDNSTSSLSMAVSHAGAPWSRMLASSRNPQPTSPYGFWGGSTTQDRWMMYRAAYVYSRATEAGDTGPRLDKRSYASQWYWWLPTGTAQTDPRLRGDSLNRWLGGTAVIGGSRGGIIYSGVDYHATNQCANSLASLEPSTTMAPTNYPLNNGYWLNQRWLRWERYQNLQGVNLASYPGILGRSSVLGGDKVATDALGWPADDSAPNQDPVTRPAGDPALANPLRDSAPSSSYPRGYAGNPIRTQNSSSYAGWAEMKADLNDYTQFRFFVDARFNSPTELANWRSVYGYPLLNGTLANAEVYSILKGNRDGSPEFGRETGINHYFSDFPETNRGSPRCDPDRGNGFNNNWSQAQCQANPLASQCVWASLCWPYSTGTTPVSSVTLTRLCAVSGTNSLHYDATGSARYLGGSCVSHACSPVDGVTCLSSGLARATSDGGIGLPADPPAPAACGFGTVFTQYATRQNLYCNFSGNFVEGSNPHLYPQSACNGQYRLPSDPDTTPPIQWIPDPGACVLGGASGGYFSTCTNAENTYDRSQTWNGNDCNNQSRTSQSTGDAPVSKFYRFYYPGYSSWSDNMVDCLAHNGTAGNTNRGYLYKPNNPTVISAGTGWNSNTSGGQGRAYTANAGETFSADSSKNIDTYHANYLRWKFGPKVCRLNSNNQMVKEGTPNATCNPIGRKTRLQVAKDVLSSLVADVNGVGLGFMALNATDPATQMAEGAYVAQRVLPTGPRNCTISSVSGSITAGSRLLNLFRYPGLAPGDSITIAGAGSGGGNLTAHVYSSVTTSNRAGDPPYQIAIDMPAQTTVSNVTVTVPACTGAASDVYPASTTEWAQYNNRALMAAAINRMTANSRTPLTEGLYEAYRYFAGLSPVWGTQPAAGIRDAEAICSGSSDSCPKGAGKYESPMLTARDANNQISPCQNNHLILISDGGSENDYSSNADIKALPGLLQNTSTGQFEKTPGVPYGPRDLDVLNGQSAANDNGYVWLDELADWMSNQDMMTLTTGSGAAKLPGTQSVTVHTIGYAGVTSETLIQAGGHGKFYQNADSAEQLKSSLLQSLSAIYLFNPQASAGSVPISALNRSEHGDDVFLAFFVPDTTTTWSGTVKKYKLGEGPRACPSSRRCNSTTTCTAGSTCADECGLAPTPLSQTPCPASGVCPNGQNCSSGTVCSDSQIRLCLTGQTVLSGSTVKNIEYIDPIDPNHPIIVNPQARSYWLPSTATPDGAMGAAGGTGYALTESGGTTDNDLNPSTRKIYTFITGTGLFTSDDPISSSADLTDSSNAAVEGNTRLSKGRLGDANMSDAMRATLLNWLRGGDPADPSCSDSTDTTTCTTWRKTGANPWAHQDVLHAKPAVMNYDNGSN